MRPTARGVGLSIAAVVLLGVGLLAGYPELTVLGAAGLAAVLFALVFAAGVPPLAVERTVEPQRVDRDAACTVTLAVANTSSWRPATIVATDRCGGQEVPVPLVGLLPRARREVSYPVPTSRRGRLRVGPLRVSRLDPFGLVTTARSHGGTTDVWVYPRRYPLLGSPPGATRSLDGLVDRVPHGSITFDSLREYVVGDELRRVHWRTSARIGQLMVREQLDTALPTLVLLLDDRASSHSGGGGGSASFESACEAAASVVAAAYAQELPVTLQLVSGARVGTGGGREARAYLDVLAEAELGAGELSTVVTRLRQAPAGDTAVFLTGPGGRESWAAVGGLRGAYRSVSGVVFEPTVAPPDASGLLSVADGAQFAARWSGWQW